MKKTITALAAGALVTFHAAHSALIYDKDGTSLDIGGMIQQAYYGKDPGNGGPVSDTGDAQLVSSGRLDIGGRTRLADGIDGISWAEWDVSDGEIFDSFSLRHSFVGLDFGPYGKIRAGKLPPAYYFVQMTSDVWRRYGVIGYDGYSDSRKGTIVYNWAGHGLDVYLSYGTSKQDQKVTAAYGGRYSGSEDRSTWTQNHYVDIEHALSGTVAYTIPEVLFGPVSLRAGYEYMALSSHRDSQGYYYNQVIVYDALTDSYIDTARYDDFNQFGLSATWGRPTGSQKGDGLYLNALYQLRTFSIVGIPKSSYSDHLEVTGAVFNVGYTMDNGMGVTSGLQYNNVAFNHHNVDALVLPCTAAVLDKPEFRGMDRVAV